MKTVMYLLRHAAAEGTDARANPPLSRLGVRQAEATRDFLAIRPIDGCYCSPLLRAYQTALIVAAPHGLVPQPLDALTEGEPGESAVAVHARAATALDELLAAHAGESVLVVGHDLLNRVYLAGLMGFPSWSGTGSARPSVRSTRRSTCKASSRRDQRRSGRRT